MSKTTLEEFKATYPTEAFLAEMTDRQRENCALMNLGAGQYIGVVCLSDVEFARLLELARRA